MSELQRPSHTMSALSLDCNQYYASLLRAWFAKIPDPSRLAQVSLLSSTIAACGGGGGSSANFTIGGNVSGLASGAQLTLDDNGGNPLTVRADGLFTFAAPVAAGGSYRVTVGTQPTGQTCSVSNGAGSNVNANVSSVAVACAANTYTVSGSLDGLASRQQITLQDNGAGSLTLTANGTFTFATQIAYGSSYDVVVNTQPSPTSEQFCSVRNGSGTIAGAVTNVQVVCASDDQVLYSFSGILDGSTPRGGLVMDSAGNLYGTTALGSGNFGIGYGDVFELSPAPGGIYTFTVLYSFTGGSDGEEPLGNLLMDSAGNLYGTTSQGGGGICTNGCGTVYELALVAGGHYIKSTLYSFAGGSDGAGPEAGLIIDGSGNLYGTTSGGTGAGVTGGTDNGTVFKLAPTAGGGYTETVLHDFPGTGSDGQNPIGGLVMDGAGNLYGTTSYGGTTGFGVVFELASTAAGYTESIVHDFGTSGMADGLNPVVGLNIDGAGNLYGTTLNGGTGGFGLVFELSPTAGGYTESVLHNFAGNTNDGGSPRASLTRNSAGNLYGTTLTGGSGLAGTVYELSPAAGGGYTETILYNFSNGTDGSAPEASVILDGAGNVYGTTSSGGNGANAGGLASGTVFEIRLH